jgi:hypothetical protein
MPCQRYVSLDFTFLSKGQLKTKKSNTPSALMKKQANLHNFFKSQTTNPSLVWENIISGYIQALQI